MRQPSHLNGCTRWQADAEIVVPDVDVLEELFDVSHKGRGLDQVVEPAVDENSSFGARIWRRLHAGLFDSVAARHLRRLRRFDIAGVLWRRLRKRYSDDQILAAIDSTVADGRSRKDAVAEVARDLGLSRRRVYELTATGAAALEQRAGEWHRFARGMRAILGGGPA